ncbi:metallophosphoesterase [Shewanella sp. HL-SH8]|uniref:metallophosphoesterase n=1 Tax=Shewanella sp. HL-SH8 TaxID=3436242 RepID=UPI003EBC1EE1
MKNILHISDLHFSSNKSYGFNTDNIANILNLLCDDVLKKINKGLDAIFITGDISFSGSNEDFSTIYELFIIPLLERFELTFDDIYFTPGNHDIDRSKVSLLESTMRKYAKDVELNDLSDLISNDKQNWERLENYLSFKEKINSQQNKIIYNSPLVTVYKHEKNMHIHCINTAWLAENEIDKGNLRILRFLKRSLDKYNAKTNIVLMHHPIDWLHEDEQSEVARELEKKVDAIFYGHMHEFEQMVTINVSQDICLKVQAGTIDIRNKNSGYSFIDLHSKNNFKYGTIYYRKYDKKLESFIPWTERSKNGKSDFSIDEQIIFDSTKFSELSRRIREKIEYSHVINVGSKRELSHKLSNIFIEPKLISEPSVNNMDPEIICLKNYNELLKTHGLTLITGTEQDGKTTLLRNIQINFLSNQSKSNLSKIVFYINAECIYNSKTKVLMAFLSDYINHELLTSFEAKVKSCINDGNAVFLIDNYHKSSTETAKSIDIFINENSKNSFILTNSSDELTKCILRTKNNYDGKRHYASIGSIARVDIRKIISLRPNIAKISSEDEIFKNIVKLVDNSQLPHNHFVYSILLVIYENKNELVGIISEADIIENYIEILLQKHCIDISLKKPPYKVLIHLMGYISKWLLLERKTNFQKNDFYRKALDFETLTFHKYEVSNYLSPLVNSGIITIKDDDSLEFSNSCFFNFFIAYFMGMDIDLRNYIFSKDNYLHLNKVVEYYSSLNSSSFDVLTFIEEKIYSLKEKISIEVKKHHKIDLDSIELDEISNISFLDIASSIKEVEQKIEESKNDKDSYDENLDQIRPLSNRKTSNDQLSKLDKDFEEHQQSLDLTLRYKQELALFSKVFRNTELLMEPERVLKIFDVIIKSYVFLIKLDVTRLDEEIVMPLLIPHIENHLEKTDITDEIKESLIDTVKFFLSIIRASIPNVIEVSMSNDLSTKKPRFINILNKKIESTTNSTEEMLLRFLLLEIERKEFKEHIKHLLKCTDKFTSNTLFLKLIQLMQERHDFSDDELKLLKKTIKGLIDKNKGVESDAFIRFANKVKTIN